MGKKIINVFVGSRIAHKMNPEGGWGFFNNSNEGPDIKKIVEYDNIHVLCNRFQDPDTVALKGKDGNWHRFKLR